MEEHKNEKLVVRYDPAICIHAGECVRGLPSVFSLSRKPWIDVNGAPAATIIEQMGQPQGQPSSEHCSAEACDASPLRLLDPVLRGRVANSFLGIRSAT